MHRLNKSFQDANFRKSLNWVYHIEAWCCLSYEKKRRVLTWLRQNTIKVWFFLLFKPYIDIGFLSNGLHVAMIRLMRLRFRLLKKGPTFSQEVFVGYIPNRDTHICHRILHHMIHIVGMRYVSFFEGDYKNCRILILYLSL